VAIKALWCQWRHRQLSLTFALTQRAAAERVWMGDIITYIIIANASPLSSSSTTLGDENSQVLPPGTTLKCPFLETIALRHPLILSDADISLEDRNSTGKAFIWV